MLAFWQVIYLVEHKTCCESFELMWNVPGVKLEFVYYFHRGLGTCLSPCSCGSLHSLSVLLQGQVVSFANTPKRLLHQTSWLFLSHCEVDFAYQCRLYQRFVRDVGGCGLMLAHMLLLITIASISPVMRHDAGII